LTSVLGALYSYSNTRVQIVRKEDIDIMIFLQAPILLSRVRLHVMWRGGISGDSKQGENDSDSPVASCDAGMLFLLTARVSQ